jgi:hypothetical protein
LKQFGGPFVALEIGHGSGTESVSAKLSDHQRGRLRVIARLAMTTLPVRGDRSNAVQSSRHSVRSNFFNSMVVLIFL